MVAGVARLGGVRVGRGLPVVVMGVINVSPESFYAGSVVHGEREIVERAMAMVEAGAGIVDVGARSSAPYLDTAIEETEEKARLARAIGALAGKLGVPISADTTRASVARAGLDAGAQILNDVSGLRDPALACLAAERGASAVLMAAPPSGDGSDPIAVVERLLREALARARAAGIAEEAIVLDPGIGFFRDEPVAWDEWDMQVLAGLEDLMSLGRPLCVGVSRKSFVGAVTGREAAGDRLAGSLAATAVAVLRGAAVVRTHDVAATLDAVRVAERARAARAG